ncbi:MAG: MFS transporter [Deltaproteobacteria bacterium]|nr:MFS transporter [Deltaproteobacteria bacterium]
MRDKILIFISSALRASAVSFSGVIIAIYLSKIGIGVFPIGLIISAGLLGAALATLAVIYFSSKFSRKTSLVLLAFLMGLGGVAFAFSKSLFVLLLASFAGMMNGMGRDRGASTTIEQAILPQTASDLNRTKTFAWYNVSMDSGHALGSLLGILPVFFRLHLGMDGPASYRWSWLLYSLICFLSGLLLFFLSEKIEPEKKTPLLKLSKKSSLVVKKISALSALDSLGGGFLTTALISFWFFKRFGADERLLGLIFFFARVANIFSHLAAAWLAKRIGLLNTMVFTHLPSSVFLMTIPFMPTLTIAIILFILRESLVEMDVPTRQSYIVAVVEPGERIHAAGITNLTRGVSWGVASFVAGSISSISLALPLIAGPSLKILYDLLLYREFRQIRPPEELKGEHR